MQTGVAGLRRAPSVQGTGLLECSPGVQQISALRYGCEEECIGLQSERQAGSFWRGECVLQSEGGEVCYELVYARE